MIGWVQQNADALIAAGMWTLAALALYCAVLETWQALDRRDLRREVEAWQANTDVAINGLHTRLDRVGAGGVHPSSPPAGTTVFSAVPALPDDQPTEAVPVITDIDSTPTNPLMDRVRPDHGEATRPDFRAQPTPRPLAQPGRHRASE